jgi:Flp pilus assembly protein TadD
MRIRVCSLASGALCVVACGGSSPTPQTAAEASPAAALSGEPSAASPPQASPPPSPELLAGIKAFDAGNYPDARRSFEAATRKNPGDFEASLNLGMSCEKLGDPSCAEAAYKSALAAKPDLEAAAEDLCALYLDAKRFDDALAVGRAGLAKHPSSGPLHENVGVALASRGDQDGAIRELRAAVDGQPSQPMYRLTLAHWLNAWHTQGAVAELDQARDLAKDDYGMIASIGFEYRLAGDFAACEKMFDRAIHMKDGGEVRTQRALCKLGEKDEKATLEDLRAAVAAEPSYAPAHYYLGGRLAIAKKFKEAAAEYTRYLELEPNGSLAKAARERLKAAEGASGNK